MYEIHEKVRKLRNQQNLTLKDLSVKTGLSVSFLSQVERGTSSLAITSLKKIADAFNVPITAFFEQSNPEKFLTRKEDLKFFSFEKSKIEYARLGGVFSGRQIEPLLVSIAPKSKQSAEFEHQGEEFYYVLEGEIYLNIAGSEYLVRKGDSIHFPSTLIHYWQNKADVKAKILCVLTPTIF